MFKPSELPVGTTIDDKVRGFWTKDSDNAWWLDSPHCVDCAEVVFDGEPTEAERKLVSNVYQFHTVPSDKFFADFEIVSFPFEIVSQLAAEIRSYDETEWHSKPDGSPFTTEDVIRDAIEEFNRPIYSADNPLKENEL